MTFQANHSDFRVTQTQKLIAAKALEAVTQQEVHPDDPRIDDFARTMVIIQNGQMGGYFGRGFNWSLASRAQREPVQVAQERFDMETKIDEMRQSIDASRGEAARRIRENRARQLRAEARELEELGYEVQNQALQLRQQLENIRFGRINGPFPREV